MDEVKVKLSRADRTTLDLVAVLARTLSSRTMCHQRQSTSSVSGLNELQTSDVVVDVLTEAGEAAPREHFIPFAPLRTAGLPHV